MTDNVTPTDNNELCRKCGHTNPPWSAASPLWNKVMRGGAIDGDLIHSDLVCASCFMVMAVDQGIASNWRLIAMTVNVPLETTTPSGRVWDDDQFLWVEMTDNVTPTQAQADIIERLKATPYNATDPEGALFLESANKIATQAAEIARLNSDLQLYMPPATISGDYGQGWVEGQAWMINCIRGEEDFDKAVPLTHALVEKDLDIARLREGITDALKCTPAKDNDYDCGDPFDILSAALNAGGQPVTESDREKIGTCEVCEKPVLDGDDFATDECGVTFCDDHVSAPNAGGGE